MKNFTWIEWVVVEESIKNEQINTNEIIITKNIFVEEQKLFFVSELKTSIFVIGTYARKNQHLMENENNNNNYMIVMIMMVMMEKRGLWLEEKKWCLRK